MMRSLALSLILLTAASCGQQGAGHQPAAASQPAQGWVSDEAHLLSTREKAALTARLIDLERTRGHQFVVVTVNSLNGQDIASYTRNLGNSWGIGRKDINDGVILLVAPTEKKVRIEVGLGLEQTLTDEKAATIIDHDIPPRFASGDMPGSSASPPQTPAPFSGANRASGTPNCCASGALRQMSRALSSGVGNREV